MVAIHILTTGGSMDKTYCGKASDFIVSSPTISQIFEEAFATTNHTIEVTEICRKDSLALDDADRESVRLQIEALPSTTTHIIVTHGTDTMWHTAHTCEATAKRLNKVVVFTGAMLPTAFNNTDAKFNVGFATAVLQMTPSGCHVVMGGLVFSQPLRIRKNLDTCVYYEAEEDRIIA
ncbi:hypothetical protein ScalyP_jg8757 [Parmales sp. scaly parma]|nr:hypothetical protein ScalyP_jg8757 [Parmales sp. scaly parma]